MKVTNIEWAVDIDEALDYLISLSCEQAAESLNMSIEKYMAMTVQERREYAQDCFHHNRVNIAEFMNLPDEIAIPDNIIAEAADYDDAINLVSDYISDITGFCHEGFTDIMSDKEKEMFDKKRGDKDVRS